MNMKTISWSKSKLVLLGSVLFLSSFFFSGQASAADCIWTAGSAANYSSTTVWKLADGTACDPAVNTVLFQGASSTANVTFDVSTTTQGITFDSAYTGQASISNGVTVTSTGSVCPLASVDLLVPATSNARSRASPSRGTCTPAPSRWRSRTSPRRSRGLRCPQ